MSLQADRPDMLSVSTSSGEASRRRRAIFQVLHPALSAEEVQTALALCDREFPADQPFSVSEFCQRLCETSSEIQLHKETRLDLLRTMRQPVEKLGSDPAPVEPAPVEEIVGDASESMPLLAEPESCDSPEAVSDSAVSDSEEEFEMLPVLDDDFATEDTEEISDSELDDIMSLFADSAPVDDTADVSPSGSGYLTALADALVIDDDTDDLFKETQEQVVNAVERITYQKTTGQPYHDDRPSPELFRLRYVNFGKSIIQ